MAYTSGLNWLASQRKLVGLTQRQLAAKAQVSPGLVAMIERGYLPTGRAKLDAIANAIDLEYEQVFHDGEADALPHERARAEEAAA